MSLDESEQKIDVREGIVHSSIPTDELARLSDDVISALKTVYDPEIPADIFELGLIYKIDIEDDRMVKIMRAAVADRDAEALRGSDGDIGTHFAGRFQQRQRQDIGGDD